MAINIQSGITSNLQDVNYYKLMLIVKAGRRVIDLLTVNSDNTVFAAPKGNEDRESFNRHIDAIIANKIRQHTKA